MISKSNEERLIDRVNQFAFNVVISEEDAIDNPDRVAEVSLSVDDAVYLCLVFFRKFKGYKDTYAQGIISLFSSKGIDITYDEFYSWWEVYESVTSTRGQTSFSSNWATFKEDLRSFLQSKT